MNTPSINEMTKKEKKLFYQIVEEQTELSGVTEKGLFKEAIVDFFDKNSETYQNLTGVQTELEKEMDGLDNDPNEFSDNQFAIMKIYLRILLVLKRLMQLGKLVNL